MQFTTNLTLKKPDGTDIVNVTDLNDNANILDAEVTKKATQTGDGRMSKEDKTKLDGIQAGAQANKVLSVAGKTGDVVLTGTDVPQATTSARGTVQLTNALTNTSTTTALTAAQGKVLKDLLDSKASNEDLTTHLADLAKHGVYGIATGANTLVMTVTLDASITSYPTGMLVAFKNTTANTGAVTLNINGLGAKSIRKANGSTLSSGNLKAGGVYQLRYDGVNFMLLGEGGEYGTAIASDVLAGKTIGTEEGLITGSIPSKDSATFIPGITNQIIASGQYLSGTQTILGDADLIASNIKRGINIFGVVGEVIEGKEFASGTAAIPADGTVTITGLPFVPTAILTQSTYTRINYNDLQSEPSGSYVYKNKYGTEEWVNRGGGNGSTAIGVPTRPTSTSFVIKLGDANNLKNGTVEWIAFKEVGFFV